MMKLELTGPGYTLRILSDPHDKDMEIAIRGHHQAAECYLSRNQIHLLQEHINKLVQRMAEET